MYECIGERERDKKELKRGQKGEKAKHMHIMGGSNKQTKQERERENKTREQQCMRIQRE